MIDDITLTRDQAEEIVFSATEHDRSYELRSDKYLHTLGFLWETEEEFRGVLKRLAKAQIEHLLLKI